MDLVLGEKADLWLVIVSFRIVRQEARENIARSAKPLYFCQLLDRNAFPENSWKSHSEP